MRVIRNIVLFNMILGLFQSFAFGFNGNLQEIKVGALLPLTGSLNSIGVSSQAAVDLAVEDINAWLERSQQPYTLSVETEDSATDPATALQGIQALQQKNIQYVVGPFASANVESVKSFVDRENMLVLSPGSSSVSLSIPDDHIYRMVADDSNQGDAVSFYCYKKKLSYIIPFYMDDSFGNSLFASTKKWVEERGGYYDEGVKIDPSASDFSGDVDALKQKVSAALAEVSSASIAIHVIAYDQTIDVLRLALQDPNLAKVKWIGNDGFTGNNSVLADADVCEFAQSVGMVSPVYQLDFDFLAYVENLMFRMRTKLQRNPEAISLLTYDSVWLSFLAERHRIETGSEDCADALESILPIFRGYTQVVRFNDNGDRFTGLYVFMDIQKKTDGYAWVKNSAFSFILGNPDMDAEGNLLLNRLLITVPPGYPETGSYTIPVLCPLTGSLSQVGQSSQKTYKMVEEDLNHFFELHDSTAEITLSIFDSQSSGSVSLDHMKNLKETLSPPFVVGPYSSDSLMSVKSFVDENNLIVISPGSTSVSLSIPNDNIYRLTMDDSKQAFALATYLYNEGIRAVTILHVDGEYGTSMQLSFKKEFEAMQGVVMGDVSYSSDETHFTSTLLGLNDQLTSVRAIYPDREIGVLLIAFDEGVEILSSANGFSGLESVRWFGSDSLANSKAIFENPNAQDFAVNTQFTASSFAPELDLSAWKTAKGRLVKSYFENYLTRYLEKFGEMPGSFNYTDYDSAWLAAMARFKLPPNPPLALVKQLMELTMKLTMGYSELNRVNENGDKGYGTFGFATVVADGDNPSWQYKSAYHFAYEYDRDDWLEYYNSQDDPNTQIGLWELF